MEHKLWGDAALGYHLVNVVLHALSAFLLARILRQLKIPGAWLAAALFALYPIEVESVAWVSELKNTLSGAFYLGAALVYLAYDRDRRGRNYAIALGLFALGLMSKTVIATLPGALLVVFWWQRGRLWWKRDALPLIPFLIVGMAAGLLTAWVERKFLHAEGAEFHFSFVERCLIAGRDIWFYLGKLIWPVDLAFFYPRWQVSQKAGWPYLFPAAIWLLLGVLAWRRWRGAMAALLFFIITLFPALGFFNVYPFRYSFVADHFQYLASMGPLTLVAAGITTAPSLLPKSKPFLLPAVCAALLLLLGTLTRKQCRLYQNADRLWQETYRLNPDCWMAHNYAGFKCLQRGQLDEGMAQFHKALEINPQCADVQDNLGIALMRKGRADEAMVHFQKALEIKPGYADAYYNLGAAMVQKGRADQAITYYRMALRDRPFFAEAHYNLAKALFDQGNVDGAITEYQQALQSNPDYANARNNLGLALLKKGRAQEAAVHFQASLETNPNDADAHFNLGSILGQKGSMEEAMAQFQKALEINPGYVDAHVNLGNIQLQRGKVDEAIAHFQKAIQLKPDDADAQNNLGNALLRKGRVSEAIAHYQAALRIQPADLAVQNNMAWLLATTSDKSLRNGPKAVELARQANGLTGGSNALILHTLAAALAEEGDFPEAMNTAQRALGLADAQANFGLVRALQAELKLYQAGSPFHSPEKRP
jgi:tetratricopeptide (TPR) repeat protein